MNQFPGAAAAMLAAAAGVAVLVLISCVAYLQKVRSQLADVRGELDRALARITELGARDEVTGAYNRRFLMEALGNERARAARSSSPFSVCLFDIDNFKQINESRGAAAGDGVLKRFAELLPAELRSIDVFGRFDGGQFLLVLPATDAQGASACAERVRRRLEASAFAELGGRRATVTVGVATHRGEEEISALVARVEEALRQGKGAGRNRVVSIG